jgi:hypothetical protein
MGFYPHRAIRQRLSALYSDFNLQPLLGTLEQTSIHLRYFPSA